MKLIRVLLADDQALFVQSLKTVIDSKDPEIEVIGIAENGEKAIEFARRDTPDIILMDVRMPVVNGVEATKILHQQYPDLKIIMLTTFDEDEYVRDAMKYGASGYLLKDMSPEQLILAIKNVYEGTVLISPSIIHKVYATDDDHHEREWYDKLTAKEKQILSLITKGYDNREIANELIIGRQTVKNYISIIYDKIGARDRMHAMRICIDSKLFD
jgi:DNA-binding NarL/FixJ family response regulator